MSQAKTPRRQYGYTMFIVLALVLLAAALSVSWTREALRVHRGTRDLHQQTQADWLVHAGFGRAVAQLRINQAYNGETWLVDAETIGQPTDAEVRIDIRRAGEGLTLTCRVRMPPGEARNTQLTRTLDLDRPQALSTTDRGEPE